MKKSLSVVLALVMLLSLFALTASAGIADNAEKLKVGTSKTFYLGYGEKNADDFSVSISDNGVLRVSLNTFGEYGTYLYVYDSNGKELKYDNIKATLGGWDNGYNRRSLISNDRVMQAKGYKEYNVKKGTYYIRVYTYYGKDKKCTVSTKFTASNSKAATDAIMTVKLKKGETLQLGTKLTPLNSNSTVTWKTSKKKVATVSPKGKVKAKAKGSTTITAKVNGIVLKIIVKVVK